MENASIGIPEAGKQDEYKRYRSYGGKLSLPTYQSALRIPFWSRFLSSSLAQAAHMYNQVKVTTSGRERAYINAKATSRTYSCLREPLSGECTSWSDQQIFAEVLLLHHYVGAHKAFKKLFPNIFNMKP